MKVKSKIKRIKTQTEEKEMIIIVNIGIFFKHLAKEYRLKSRLLFRVKISLSKLLLIRVNYFLFHNIL